MEVELRGHGRKDVAPAVYRILGILRGDASGDGIIDTEIAGNTFESWLFTFAIGVTGGATVGQGRAWRTPLLLKVATEGRHFALNALGCVAVATALGADRALHVVDDAVGPIRASVLIGVLEGAGVAAPAAAVEVLRVPADVSTLSAAVDQIDDGGIIEMTAGTYPTPPSG